MKTHVCRSKLCNDELKHLVIEAVDGLNSWMTSESSEHVQFSFSTKCNFLLLLFEDQT